MKHLSEMAGVSKEMRDEKTQNVSNIDITLSDAGQFNYSEPISKMLRISFDVASRQMILRNNLRFCASTIADYTQNRLALNSYKNCCHRHNYQNKP